MSAVNNSSNHSKPPEKPPEKGCLDRFIDAYGRAYNNGRPSEVCKISLPDKCKHPDAFKTEECQKIYKQCVEFWVRFDRWPG